MEEQVIKGAIQYEIKATETGFEIFVPMDENAVNADVIKQDFAILALGQMLTQNYNERFEAIKKEDKEQYKKMYAELHQKCMRAHHGMSMLSEFAFMDLFHNRKAFENESKKD